LKDEKVSPSQTIAQVLHHRTGEPAPNGNGHRITKREFRADLESLRASKPEKYTDGFIRGQLERFSEKYPDDDDEKEEKAELSTAIKKLTEKLESWTKITSS